MALTGVLRPGHAQVRVLDLEASIHFYRDGQGRVYFKCWDERDHNSYVIRQADSAGIDFFGFKVLDKASLDKLDADLQAYGLKTERIPAGEMLETGERVRFTLPSGHAIELYADKAKVGNGMSLVNPPPWSTARDHGIGPIRLDHTLLYGPNIGRTRPSHHALPAGHVLHRDAGRATAVFQRTTLPALRRLVPKTAGHLF